MPAWGNTQARPNAGRGATGDEARSRPKPGIVMGLVFGGIALVAVALCSLLLLMQRNEHRKLMARVEERDQKIEELAGRVEGAARDADDARKERQVAKQELDSYQRGAAANEAKWAQERADLEKQREDLRNELDETTSKEERLAAEAKESLRKSDVVNLKPRAPDGPCIERTTAFKQSVTVEVAGALGQQLAAPAARAAEGAMLAQKLPFATGFRAYVEIRIHGRSLPVGTSTCMSIAVEASLIVPLVAYKLDEMAWSPCKTEIDTFAVSDPNLIESTVVQQVADVVDRLISRGLYGGPAGQLAARPIPQAAAPPQASGGSGSTPPSAPAPTPPPSTPPSAPPPPTPRPPKP